MSYQQLTEGQRYQLSVLRAQGMSILATARAIGVHRSTLYRSCVVTPGRRATSQTMRISTPPTDGPVRPNLGYLPMSSSLSS